MTALQMIQQIQEQIEKLQEQLEAEGHEGNTIGMELADTLHDAAIDLERTLADD